MKRCKSCKKEKSLRCFYKKEGFSEGFFYNCVECRLLHIEDVKIKRKEKSIQLKEKRNLELIKLRNSNFKECTKCRNVKNKNDFGKDRTRFDGLCGWCKICKKSVRVISKKSLTFEQKARHSLLQNKRNKEKKKKSSLFKLLYNLRNRNYFAFKNPKKLKTSELLGIDIKLAKKYIENLFYVNSLSLDPMSWDNYGKGPGKWQIDHIVPLGSAVSSEELVKLCHYTNLQPLWHEDHSKKTVTDINFISFIKNNNKNNMLVEIT